MVDDLTMRGGMVDGACLQPHPWHCVSLPVLNTQSLVWGSARCSLMRLEMAIRMTRGTDCQLRFT